MFLLPDQLRPDFLGCYGADFLWTPAIDGLAARGTRFETALSPSPICVPARASLLTGQSAASTGVIDNHSWLRPDRRKMGARTIPEFLTDAGYRTCAVGKMHFYPWDISEGFDERIIAEDKRHIHIEDDYAAFLEAAGHRKLHGRDQRLYDEQKGASLSDLRDRANVDRWVADQTAEWIEGHSGEQPFFLMVGFPGPHCPYDPPEDALSAIDPTKLPEALPPAPEDASLREAMTRSYRNWWAEVDYETLSADEIRKIRHHYAALVERLDQDVATILAALERAGSAKETVVVFASDHGDYLGDHGLIGKTYFHEASLRVPLIVADPRKPVAAVDPTPATLIDLLPTFLELAGLPPAAQAEGRSLLSERVDEPVIGVTTHGVMVRTATHKLVRHRSGAEALYDLASDPFEAHNLIDDPAHTAIRRTLEIALVDRLLAGMKAGHMDKHVTAASAPEPHAFHKRGWQRPYPPRVWADPDGAASEAAE
nr:sulfatase-like hydrolase/transferase [Boseongicola sp. H5]